MQIKKFQDPSFPAAFDALKKDYIITPRNNPETQLVEFEVQGQNIDEAIQAIYENKPVGVLDFIRALKSYRSAIFALKRQRNGVTAS
ncbi:MAG: hypothetical protein IBX72_03900 [Nitrospirae bacterium]|nr:hypothetical protein [Nitrospirota bacterium]